MGASFGRPMVVRMWSTSARCSAHERYNPAITRKDRCMNEMDYFDDEVESALDAVMLARLAGGDAPEMDIDAYRLLVGAVAPATDGQIEAFADYVASAHSWYKHLPLQPPGVDFHFYIDPNAGMDHLVDASGEV